MTIDSKLAHLLSDFFLDIAKAYFIGTFVTPSLIGSNTLVQIIGILTKGMLAVILLLIISWKFAKLEKEYERN